MLTLGGVSALVLTHQWARLLGEGGGGGDGGGDGGGGNCGGEGGVNMQMHCLDEEHEPELPPPRAMRTVVAPS